MKLKWFSTPVTHEQKYSRLNARYVSKVWYFISIWAVQTKYNKGRFKVMATYLKQYHNFEYTYTGSALKRAKFL